MAESAPPLIVAIDGPSGVGKSTAAQELARRLGVPYLETGAMYRAVALEALEHGVDPDDRPAVEALAETIDLVLEPTAEGRVSVVLRGEPVGERVRAPEVTDAASRISIYPGVRREMVERQRACGRRLGAVVEGRDIGSKVFPETPFKFFLDADPAVRAERRYRELTERGKAVSAAEVAADLAERDRRDAERRDSPLRRDQTYILVDSSRLDATSVVEAMLARIEELRAGCA